MIEPQWMTYAGFAFGLLGAMTGVAGAAMGWVAYRRSNQIKAIDMRLELRKAINEVGQTVDELNNLLTLTNQSRERIMAARGLLGSGAMTIWQEQFRNDHARFGELVERKPDAEGLGSLEPEQLETRLAETHKLQLALTALVTKYKASLAEDDQHRAENRQAMNNIQNRAR